MTADYAPRLSDLQALKLWLVSGFDDTNMGRMEEYAMAKKGYPKHYAVQVPDSQWIAQSAAARELGVSKFRAVVLLANGHLLAAKDSSGRPGVSAASVVKEREWRGNSSFGRRFRRAFLDVVQWIS